MTSIVAVLNAGSSSIKFAVRGAADGLPLLLRGQVEAIGVAPKLTVKGADGSVLEAREFDPQGFDHDTGTRAIIGEVRERLS